MASRRKVKSGHASSDLPHRLPHSSYRRPPPGLPNLSDDSGNSREVWTVKDAKGAPKRSNYLPTFLCAFPPLRETFLLITNLLLRLLPLGFGLLDGADVQERVFRQVVPLAVADFFEAADRFG